MIYIIEVKSAEHDEKGTGMKMHSSITFDRIEEACKRREVSLDNPGFCIACGADHDECEPDARNYTCYECGQNEVFGAEECLMFL